MGTHKELLENELIDQEQFDFLELIKSREKVSVFYELRSILYLGIILFTGGVAYFAYLNFTQIGHLVSMALLIGVLAISFSYVHKWALPYSNDLVVVDHSYFDYLLLLIALLWVSFLTYVQIYFDWVEQLIRPSSTTSTLLFLYLAYRYDNKAILVLAITALAATVGLTVSPLDWLNGGFDSIVNLYVSSIILGLALCLIGNLSNFKKIKPHFRTTFLHFGYLLFQSGLLVALFDNESWLLIGLNLIVSSTISFIHWKTREFMFFFYANIVFYISATYFLFRVIDDAWFYFLFYFPLSLIAYAIFIVSFRKHFSND